MRHRRSGNREQRNNILIAVEGKTEETYMGCLIERGVNVRISTVCDANRTKPYQIVEYCRNEMKNHGIDLKAGDAAFAVFDTDDNTKDDFQKAAALADRYGIKMIISNPCFEIWMLMHFREHQIPLIDKERIKAELRKGIGAAYQKNKDYRNLLLPRKAKAVKNSKNIAKERDLKEPLDYFMTTYSSNMHTLIDCIETLKEKNRLS